MNFTDWAGILGSFILVIVLGLVFFWLQIKADGSGADVKGVSSTYYWSSLVAACIGVLLVGVHMFGKLTGDGEPALAVSRRVS
jgi:hypothetical protein